MLTTPTNGDGEIFLGDAKSAKPLTSSAGLNGCKNVLPEWLFQIYPKEPQILLAKLEFTIITRKQN
jgi:hypothetical protein